MARKDLLKGLMTPTADDRPAAPTAAPRSNRGAIGAVSQSLSELKSRALVDVPADLIDMAGMTDRLDEDEEGIAALKASIREYGQQVPVMLRESTTEEGRFDIVFGRRRVRALKELRLPVRAMVRSLSDRELVVAQGQENNARKNLSFIEKASFAAQMQAAGYDRKIICDALSIDKTVISRMLMIVDALPTQLIQVIGSAPGAGRDRWLTLVEKAKGKPVDTLIAAAVGPDSDARFLAVLSSLTPPRTPAQEVPLADGTGKSLGKALRQKRKTVIELTGEGRAFGDWLLEQLPELHRQWKDK
ncbi:plasmid partitioning protein RepB [Paracoccus sp. 1_MG-2023]|uniref:plasmid partitioning protein RepB n=1 Tax=unclassified Paracoccus (in: a-proteobacteria) TaxID=2688777 RepID=UPI001C08C83C|nr:MULTISPECIES: plasmid partitioning protein RepB [unclassified Paracoccus (in: a-proteobacteria)]MBU2959208.1 plasmid partitioning protein RepB [Paracoccus sp. C2R09]MDO6670055.1 plasmid partitioning protein RepB [Paracoccus sp. 1_MG-2023]